MYVPLHWVSPVLVTYFLLLSACQTVTGPSEPDLSVIPGELVFGQVQESFPLAVSNLGGGTLSWNITQKPDWVELGALSGSDTTLHVVVRRADLENGEYVDSLVIVSNGGDQTIPLRLKVDGPFLSVSSKSLDFQTDLEKLTLKIANIGNGVLSYNLAEDADWLQVSPADGQMAEQPVMLQLSVDRTDLADGDYSTNLEIRTDANTVIVPISMNVPVPGG